MDPWMQAMARGDFAAAWRISDAVLRLQRADPSLVQALPPAQRPLWDGQPIAGRRVLVHCNHGLGDTLQFVRLLPLLRRQARAVILRAQPALLGLLEGAAGIDRLLSLDAECAPVERDSDVELMELPHLLRVEAATLPAAVPYLRVPPTRSLSAVASSWGAGLPSASAGAPGTGSGTRLRVGLAWHAGEWNPARSIPGAALEPLAAVAAVDWLSLQFGHPPPRFAAADAACADLVEQARRMQALDLVVSVDTMVAHLAGALALPVWTLLPADCDWRWMRGRSDSPWYPTMRLFRQRTEGDWTAVVEAVCTDLHAAAEQRFNPPWHARKAVSRSAAAGRASP